MKLAMSRAGVEISRKLPLERLMIKLPELWKHLTEII
jgi:hypothetical protein